MVNIKMRSSSPGKEEHCFYQLRKQPVISMNSIDQNCKHLFDQNGNDSDNNNDTWHDCPGKDSEQYPGKPGQVVRPDAPTAWYEFSDDRHNNAIWWSINHTDTDADSSFAKGKYAT